MIWLVLCFLGIDIISKIIISNFLLVGDSIRVINNFFNITYVKNTGAAFSMFDDKGILVLIVSVIIILGLLYYVYKNKPVKRILKLGYAMIIGGAIGNLVDRIGYGYVRDFLDFKIFGEGLAIFNLADTFIVVGVGLLIIDAWRNRNVRD